MLRIYSSIVGKDLNGFEKRFFMQELKISYWEQGKSTLKPLKNINLDVLDNEFFLV
jgi:hypothetical protein